MTHQYIHSQLLRKYRKDSKIKWIVKNFSQIKETLTTWNFGFMIN